MNTYSHLNQIFYIPKKFDNDCSQLKPYMMTYEYLQLYVEKKDVIIDVENAVKKSEAFRPNQRDGLFWCIYIIFHGMNEYMMIQNKHKNKEMDEKHKILQYIQNNGQMIKDVSKECNHKITQVGLKEIQSELLLNTKLSYSVFAVLCIYYKINAIIRNGSIYMHFHTNQEHTYFFTQTKKGMEVELVPLSQDDISHIQSTCILVPYEQDKPLKAISNYKVNELDNLANKLQLEVVKMKKQELYNTILLKLVELQN